MKTIADSTSKGSMKVTRTGGVATSATSGRTGVKVEFTIRKSNMDLGDKEYTDAQFDADLEKASPKLEVLADRARRSLKDRSARKFPE